MGRGNGATATTAAEPGSNPVFFSKSRDIVVLEKDRGDGSPPRSETLWRKQEFGSELSTRRNKRRVHTTPPLETSVDQKQRRIFLFNSLFTIILTQQEIRFPINVSSPAPVPELLPVSIKIIGDLLHLVWAVPLNLSAVHAHFFHRLSRRRWPEEGILVHRRLHLKIAGVTVIHHLPLSMTATTTTRLRRWCFRLNALLCRLISTRRRWRMLTWQVVRIYTAPFYASDHEKWYELHVLVCGRNYDFFLLF